MRTEKEIIKFLTKCNSVRGYGLSIGPCPLEKGRGDRRGCCAECSFPSAIEWVLNRRENGSANGQERLIEVIGKH
jgi:hypothetical protein